MLLLLLAYLGGMLTILSPCILPVLPFVFARTGQPFRRSGLPLLAGMALTFAAATLAAVGRLPPLDGALQWLNSKPLTAQYLKGKVVLIDFWTYSCINCLRSQPYGGAHALTFG